jgi:hypothetical protein
VHNEESKNGRKPRDVFRRLRHQPRIIVLGAVESQLTHLPIFEFSMDSVMLTGINQIICHTIPAGNSETQIAIRNNCASRKIAADSLRQDLLRGAFDRRGHYGSDSPHHAGMAPGHTGHSAPLFGFALVCKEGQACRSEVQTEASTAQEKDSTKA